MTPEQIAVLTAPTHPSEIEWLEAEERLRGKYPMPYTKHQAVVRRFNAAFAGEWSGEVVGQPAWHEDGPGKGHVVVVYRLSAGGCRREQGGGCRWGTGMPRGDALKGAISLALRKCASLYGFGLDLMERPCEATDLLCRAWGVYGLEPAQLDDLLAKHNRVLADIRDETAAKRAFHWLGKVLGRTQAQNPEQGQQTSQEQPQAKGQAQGKPHGQGQGGPSSAPSPSQEPPRGGQRQQHRQGASR